MSQIFSSSQEPAIKIQLKVNKFQQKCGQCFLQLEQYKLKVNLIGCNMSKEELSKYYSYYDTKPKKRLQASRNRLENVIKAFERNAIYLQALELKAVNNMLQIHRKRNDLLLNEPTGYSSSKVQKESQELLDYILAGDQSKLQQVQKILVKVKREQQSSLTTLEEKLQNNKNSKPNFARALKAINKAEVRYFRYFENFQRSIANMTNQIHAHMEKLNQFYTAWENLGSSIIYEMKSDRQVFIDKTAEERQFNRGNNRMYGHMYRQETEEQIEQVINVMPPNSKTKLQHQQKLTDFRAKQRRVYAINTNMNFNRANFNNKQKKSNLKAKNNSIHKVSWYETATQDLKQYNPADNLHIRQNQDCYFRYTFQQLHKETSTHLADLQSQIKVQNADRFPGEETYKDRFYIFSEKRLRDKNKTPEIKIEKQNVPPQMNFGCWYDRLGSKGFFNVQDFPINLVQRKLEFQYDRQVQMEKMDEKRKKQYSLKQSKINLLEDQTVSNFGYKQLDSSVELHKLRMHLTSLYNSEFLPKPKPKNKKTNKSKQLQDFSDEENQQVNKKQTSANNIGTDRILIEQQLKNQKIGNFYSRNFQFELTEHTKQRQKIKELTKQNQMIAIEDLQKSYPWLSIKQRQKQPLQTFVQCYLPQCEKMLISKMKADLNKLGLSEDEIQTVHYKFLHNFEVNTIKSCLSSVSSFSKASTDGLDKFYLIHRQCYIKIEQLFFHNSKKIVKIQIIQLIRLSDIQNLKSNLEKLLSCFGKCNFKLHYTFIDANITPNDRFYGLIGSICRSMKLDKRMKNLLINEAEANINELVEEGMKIYQAFQTHNKNLKQVQGSNIK